MCSATENIYAYDKYCLMKTLVKNISYLDQRLGYFCGIKHFDCQVTEHIVVWPIIKYNAISQVVVNLCKCCFEETVYTKEGLKEGQWKVTKM